jgi:hypothetical protein
MEGKTSTIIEDDPDFEKNRPCRNPQHDPPSLIVIPQGKQMRHTCPGCGKTVVVRPASVYWMVDHVSKSGQNSFPTKLRPEPTMGQGTGPTLSCAAR